MTVIKLHIGCQELTLTYDGGSAMLENNSQYTATKHGEDIVLISGGSNIETIATSTLGGVTDVWVDGDPKTRKHALFSGNRLITGTKTFEQFELEQECRSKATASDPFSAKARAALEQTELFKYFDAAKQVCLTDLTPNNRKNS